MFNKIININNKQYRFQQVVNQSVDRFPGNLSAEYKLSYYCWASSRYDKISDKDRSANHNRYILNMTYVNFI